MKQTEAYRKSWNKRQTQLRAKLQDPKQHTEAIQLFLSQHAMLHAQNITQAETWSFEDAILNDMRQEQIRRIPRNCEHSIAWVIWHIARIEDVTMNILVAGSEQILDQENWMERMRVAFRDTGNAMGETDVSALSAMIDVDALRAYRLAVGQRTREIVQSLQPEALLQKVKASRLQRVRDQGAVVAAASGLIEYWGKRTIAGLLLMPPTRHNFVHLNEALRLKRRRQ